MSKPKICVMSSVHPPFDVRIFHKQCRSLVQAGYDVTLVVPHDKEEYIDGVRIKAVSKPRNRKERFLKTGRAVYRKALAVNADIYHIHDPELLFYGQLLRLRRKKVIYDMHENLPRDILTKKWITPMLRNLLANLVHIAEEKVLLNGLYIIFAETSYKKDYPWVTNYTDILNMPDIEYLIGLSTDKKYEPVAIGYVGGVSSERGSTSMLEAISIIQNKGLKCSFHCIGPADEEHQMDLRATIKKLHLTDICLYGYMVPTQAWDIIRKCHIGVAVLNPDPNFYGSYPTKLFEYMALGIPVITSRFPLYQDVVEGNKCGICVDPLNTNEIADAIMWIVSNPAQAKEMGENGRRAVKKKYNWEQEAQKLLNLYGELLNECVV